jgi:hypothetical protein
MELKPEILRLRSFIEECGGIYNASFKLGVRPSTLTKALNERYLSQPTTKKLHRMIETKITSAGTSRSESKLGSSSQLKEKSIITTDIIEAWSKLGVHASILKKIVEGAPIPRGMAKKIRSAFKNSPELKGIIFHKPSMVERLLYVYNLYREKGTLEAVGKEIGLTRERVRQLLVKGTQLGLFEYKAHDYPFIPKEKIIEDYKKFLNLNVVARRNNISASYLHKLLTAYNITEKDLQSIRIEGQKLKCIEEYDRIRVKLDHHPTTTELQRSKLWRYLSIKVTKLWGSFEAFREELNIPRPPSFVEATQKWRDHKRRVALIARMQHLDSVRECLSTSAAMAISQIASDCSLTIARTRRILGLLIATKEVTKQGGTSHTKYCLVERRGGRWV